MKQSHLMSLFQEGMTTVVVTFGKDAQREAVSNREPEFIDIVEIGNPIRRRVPAQNPAYYSETYTYKAPIKAGYKAGDLALVDSPKGGLCVVTILEVHDTPQIDVDADFDYKWLVQKVDLTEYKDIQAKEAQFRQLLNEMERAKVREQLKKDYVASLPEGSEASKLFEQATHLFGTSENV